MKDYWTSKNKDIKANEYYCPLKIKKKVDKDIVEIDLQDYLNSFLENVDIEKINFDIQKKNVKVVSEFYKLLNEQINVNNIVDQDDTNIEQAEKLEKVAERLRESE